MNAPLSCAILAAFMTVGYFNDHMQHGPDEGFLDWFFGLYGTTWCGIMFVIGMNLPSFS